MGRPVRVSYTRQVAEHVGDWMVAAFAWGVAVGLLAGLVVR